MQPEPSPGELTAFNLVNKVIYGAFLFSLIAYWLVLKFVILPEAQSREAEHFPLLSYLPLVAGFDALLALYFRYARLGSVLAEVSGDFRRRMTHARMFYIICWVLSESVALFGFAIPFFTANLNDAAPYFVASVALFALCYPKSLERPLGV